MVLMQKIKVFFTKVWTFIKKHKWSISLIILAIAIGGFFIWDSFTATGGINFGDIKLRPKPEVKVRAPISGNLVPPDVAQKKPVAIVIENHPDARPQSGLNSASLVFETFAEGGITRFLAIFQEGESREIGPVRSARTYFVDWAASYKALFAHVGGNIDALDMLPKSGAYDINQFYFGNFFWRDNKRYAPHNVYTTVAKLYEAAKTKNYPTTDSNISAFLFKDDLKKEERSIASSFTVNFNQSFAVTYSYDPEKNSYLRSMSKIPQKDNTTGEQIVAKNVIVCFSDFSYGKTRIGEQKTTIRTTGKGNALFFIDGARNTGTWSRQSGGITRFFDANGNEIKLNAGTTWVEFAPIGTQVN